MKGTEMDPKCKATFWDKNPEAKKHVDTDQKELDVGVAIIYNWLEELEQEYEIDNFMMAPAGFDWMFVKPFLEIYKPQGATFDISKFYSPVCISSIFKEYCQDQNLNKKEQGDLKAKLMGASSITHKAHEDARFQAALYFNLKKYKHSKA